MTKNEIWKLVIQTLITILTAIGTSIGMTSCMQKSDSKDESGRTHDDECARFYFRDGQNMQNNPLETAKTCKIIH